MKITYRDLNMHIPGGIPAIAAFNQLCALGIAMPAGADVWDAREAIAAASQKFNDLQTLLLKKYGKKDANGALVTVGTGAAGFTVYEMADEAGMEKEMTAILNKKIDHEFQPIDFSLLTGVSLAPQAYGAIKWFFVRAGVKSPAPRIRSK